MGDHLNLNHPSNHPPPYFRPNNIDRPMDQNTIAYIETAMPPPPPLAPPASTPAPAARPQHDADGPHGVLKRNQACKACRKRKLKCDAVKPHCSTCVRSYKHLLRTSPKSNPVLTCEYDDGVYDTAAAAGLPGQLDLGLQSHAHAHASPAISEEDDEGRKRKRKSGISRPRESSGISDEREALMQRIAELEAQVQAKNAKGSADPNRSWSTTTSQPMPDLAAPSPTAFLEMLSSAASAQADQSGANSVSIGMRQGANNETMMGNVAPWGETPTDSTNAREHTGWTPMFPSGPPDPTAPRSPAPQHSRASASAQSIASTSRPMSGSHQNSGTADPSPNAPPGLSPNAIFTFSPGPTGPSATSIPNVPAPANTNWPPAPDANGNIQPSTRLDGPWRAVETVETVFQSGMGKTTLDATATFTATDSDMPQLDEALQQQLLMDLFWPGWPPNLPEPNIVNDLIESFFDLVPNMSRLLHRPRFLARMALPPTHSNFPHPALIHAICCSAAAWCPPSVYERSSYVQDATWMFGTEKGSRAAQNFGMRQAAFAKEAVQDGLNTGNRLFDVVRAMIILSRVFIDDTRMLECWAYCGLVARMSLPLGLNVRSAELSLKSVMLPPPVDALEREERRVAMWMAFYHDTVASSASGWGTSISLEELSVPLPVAVADFEAGSEFMEPNPQDLDSPDFWTKHPVADPFVMAMKAAVIMNRVNRFVRRWKNRRLREDDDLDGLQRPDFRELANAIACFQMSFPAALRNPCKLNAKRKLDIDLISAHMLPHAATICLHEPFADITDPNDPATRRMIAACQSMVNIVQQLASVLNDGVQNFASIMHSSASVCLVTSARTSLLFYRYALNVGDSAAAEGHRMDIEMIRMALAQYGAKFKIGHHHAQLLEYFLDRSTNPTLEKLQAHYPEHPRPGAPELHPNCNLGHCIMNALNIKRGYWKLPASNVPSSNGVSPFTSTPESTTNMHPSMPPRSATSQSAASAGLPENSPKTSRGSSTAGVAPFHGMGSMGGTDWHVQNVMRNASGLGEPKTSSASPSSNAGSGSGPGSASVASSQVRHQSGEAPKGLNASRMPQHPLGSYPHDESSWSGPPIPGQDQRDTTGPNATAPPLDEGVSAPPPQPWNQTPPQRSNGGEPLPVKNASRTAFHLLDGSGTGSDPSWGGGPENQKSLKEAAAAENLLLDESASARASPNRQAATGTQADSFPPFASMSSQMKAIYSAIHDKQ